MTPADLILSILRFALNSVFASLPLDSKRDVEDLKAEREAAAAMLTQLDPRDAIQAAFAARAVTTHHASMECFRRAARLDEADAMVNRLMATGMALSRQSEQLIKALQKRKDTAGSGVSADAKAILAAAATARATPAGQQPGAPASRPMKDMPARNPGLDSPGTAGSPAPDPREAVSGDRGPAEPGNSPSAIQYRNRQERRQAERQAVKAAARQNTQHNHAGHPAIMAA